MKDTIKQDNFDAEQIQEWVESFRSVIKFDGINRASSILSQLKNILGSAFKKSNESNHIRTPYKNTIHRNEEPDFPGDLELEKKITHIMRWNSMAMVLQANKSSDGIGGHIASYASSAVLYEVGFNHFFKGNDGEGTGDQIFYQGHITPGIYARAFLEGRLSESQIKNFRRELAPGGGLPSYPHPRLLPNFWQYPTVSMGLSAMMSIYLARFYKYLQNRDLFETKKIKIWSFLGDGEMDEPESLGSLSFASYQGLDNLIFVVNCNLQKLDGPVRGNGSVIRELEGVFKGANWNVIKVLWDSHWDELFEKDTNDDLSKIMEQTVDGEYQKFSISSPEEIRQNFFGKSEATKKLAEDFSDEKLSKLKRGGHDQKKVYAAYAKAVSLNNGKPTVILVKTVKGYGMGESGEGRNIAHQQKKMSMNSLKGFRDRFSIPISDADLEKIPFFVPDKNSPEIKYLHQRRKVLNGYLPIRTESFQGFKLPSESIYDRFYKGTGGREISTTMALVQVLSSLLRDKDFGRRVVPIIPDESRTFGMEGLFREYRIYSPKGQLYEPVDQKSLLPYKESKSGQILEEGITEAGSVSSFIASGTSYSHLGFVTVPFYFFYSMFGFQRVGDFIWAACDMKCKGFLIGGTAGRTTLNGEGLQHEDGHSPILASTFPTIQTYDPAYHYEIALIVKDGLKRMYVDQEDIFYYLTVYNENYAQIPMPDGCEEGVLKGMYKLKKSTLKKDDLKVQLLASGVILQQALKSIEILEKECQVSCDLWSVTSYKLLREESLVAERYNRFHPNETPKKSYLQNLVENEKGIFLAVSDYMCALPNMVAPWIPGGLEVLGTDGFGKSSSRKELRDYFEVDVGSIVLAALYGLYKKGNIDLSFLQEKMKDFNYDANKSYPLDFIQVN